MTAKRFVMVDRDGTILRLVPYLADPAEVELLPRAAKGLKMLKAMGLGVVVITNQSGIGRGYFDCRQVDLIHTKLGHLLDRDGVQLDRFYYCPHCPGDNCDCRKPKPGLVRQASREFSFDPRASFMIGDNLCDIQLGRAVGARTLLIRTGYGSRVAPETGADHVVNDLEQAARIIQNQVN